MNQQSDAAAPVEPAGEQSSTELATLAGQALADPAASDREKRLAGSVLTQFEAAPAAGAVDADSAGEH